MRSTFALIAVSLSLSVLGTARAQSETTMVSGETRPRAVNAAPLPANTAPDATPRQSATIPAIRLQSNPASVSRDVPPQSKLTGPVPIKTRIAEAERLLKTRPRQTAMASPALDVVTLALTDQVT